jgi:hypothetical protein
LEIPEETTIWPLSRSKSGAEKIPPSLTGASRDRAISCLESAFAAFEKRQEQGELLIIVARRQFSPRLPKVSEQGPISPISALPGTSRTLISVVLLLGVALLMGFRPVVDPAAWLAALGVIALFTVAVTWLGVAFGLGGKTPAGANSLSLSFLLLAFTSSAFVRPETMPTGVRWFAVYQPFTPVIETVRGLLLGTPIGNSLVLAVAWSVVLSLVGYFWARAVYNHNSVAFNFSALR